MARQLIRHDADHIAARGKAGVLRRAVCACRIAGDEHKALPCGKPADPFGKDAVFGKESPGTDKADAGPFQQTQIPTPEQKGGGVVFQPPQAGREAFRQTCQHGDALLRRPGEKNVQRRLPLQQRCDMLRGGCIVAETEEIALAGRAAGRRLFLRRAKPQRPVFPQRERPETVAQRAAQKQQRSFRGAHQKRLRGGCFSSSGAGIRQPYSSKIIGVI